MPRLDLLAEDELDLAAIGLGIKTLFGVEVIVERQELFGAEGTDIVEV